VNATLIVVLQDGRQLDGWMRPFEYAFECEHVVFLAYEIDSICPQSTSALAISRQSGQSVRRDDESTSGRSVVSGRPFGCLVDATSRCSREGATR
jgi:hypothetical protein